MRVLRLLTSVFALTVLAGAFAGSALAAPKSGFYVFKDLRNSAVVEFRDASGEVVWSDASVGEKSASGTACGDSRHTMIGARWETFPAFFVNLASTPGEIDAAATLADLRSAHDAWTDPWRTDCSEVPGRSRYEAFYGGPTNVDATIVTGVLDGVNTVAFRSLRGTFCDAPGVVACVVAWSESGRFVEADMALQDDLTSLGGDYRWTTRERTAFRGNRGEFAVSDVATHEWGHFGGLGHVKNSPALTMFPAIHDGMQTLGLGDMKGLLARY